MQLAPASPGIKVMQQVLSRSQPKTHVVHSTLMLVHLQGYAVALADGLGLRSIACVDGFVNVDSGEMIVMDVKPNPPLTDGSPIFQQVSWLV